ncbi:MAG: helical backbone metal receptor [Burkholderiaceae bacterium]|nr:helical backbone metal receptor [Burkholderiaceae bacterium]
MRGCRSRAALLALVLGLPAWGMALPSAAAAPAIVVQDDRGSVQSFAVAPQRVVSLLPSLTESVCALGACDRLVGTDRYSNSPSAVVALPKLGGIEDANLERIVALRPDVVLAAPSTRVVERLESLGLKVVLLESKTHADVRRSLTVLATLLGRPDAAEPLWNTIQRQVQQAAAAVPVALRGQKVYFEVDATPFAAGAGSFIGETLAQLGMANVVPAALGSFPQLNPEYIVRAQPDIVMAVQRDLEQMPRRPGWARIDALQQHRACGFSSERYEVLVRPGPRLGEAAQLLAECLRGLETQAR